MTLHDQVWAFIKEAYRFSSTQVDLNDGLATKIRHWSRDNIDKDDLYFDPKDHMNGYDIDPHLTLLYGIKDNEHAKVRSALNTHGPVKLEIGKVTAFTTSPKYDVLKLEVHGKDIHDIHHAIRGATDHVLMHPEYNPHITLAYLKKGRAEKYVGQDPFEGHTLVSNRITFSGKDGNMANIPLGQDIRKQASLTDKFVSDIAHAVMKKLSTYTLERADPSDTIAGSTPNSSYSQEATKSKSNPRAGGRFNHDNGGNPQTRAEENIQQTIRQIADQRKRTIV